MRKINSYAIVEDVTALLVVSEVNRIRATGFEPYGNLQIAFSKHGTVTKYIQPVVRYSEGGTNG